MAISSPNTNSSIIQDATVHWNQKSITNNILSKKKERKSRQLEKEIIGFLVLTENVGKTRNELVKHLNFPRTTIFDSLNRMNSKGLIERDYKLSKKGKGRPQTIYYLKGLTQGLGR